MSAGAGAGAGIAYLNGGDYKTIAHTIVNALAITSGIVCDGAKRPARPRSPRRWMPGSWDMRCM